MNQKGTVRSPLRCKTSFPNLLRGIVLHLERINHLNGVIFDRNARLPKYHDAYCRAIHERAMLWDEIKLVLIECGMNKFAAASLVSRLGWGYGKRAEAEKLDQIFSLNKKRACACVRG